MVAVRIAIGTGKGTIYVYQNSVYIGLVSEVTGPILFNFNVNDMVTVSTQHGGGYKLDKTCFYRYAGGLLIETYCFNYLNFDFTIPDFWGNSYQFIVDFVKVTKHNICQNNICIQVDGIGANECSTPGVACTHKACWNNVCTALDGPGTDECTTIGAACGNGGNGGVTRYNCVSGVCQPSETGQFDSYADCIASGCGSGGDGEEGDPCDMCSDKEICLFESCYKKSDAVMAVGAVVLLMMLTR